MTGIYSPIDLRSDKTLPIFFFGNAVFVRPSSIHDATPNGVVTPELLGAMYLPDHVFLPNLFAGENIHPVKQIN